MLALVQDRERDPAQEAFVRQLRGSWEEGHFAPQFTDSSNVALAVVRALSAWRDSVPSAERASHAGERALGLARGTEHRGFSVGGSKLRVVAVPLVSRPLLDALGLQDETLVDDLASAARSSRLVRNEMAITAASQVDGIRLVAKGERGWEQLELFVGIDGAVVAEGAVAGGGNFGGSVVMADRARNIVERGLAFALAAWQRVDQRDEIRDAPVVLAVPDAQHKVFALSEPGSSMHMPMSLPSVVIAPESPVVVRRADFARAETTDRLLAELRRAFELADALFPRPGERRALY